MKLSRSVWAVLVLPLIVACSDATPPPETERGLLDDRHAVVADLLAILTEIPDPLPMSAASERLRSLAAESMPAIDGSWEAFQTELGARLREPGYGQRAQAYQELKSRFETELERLREDPILWRNLAPELARFNSIFQP